MATARLPGWLDSTIRIVRGVWILLVLFLSLFVGSSSFHSPLLLLLWSFSSRFWRTLNSTFIEMWHTLFIFYLEVWNSKRWLVSGDDVPPKERAFIISNHPSEVDWMCWWPIAWRKGMVGDLKVILKKEIAYVPALGNGMDDLEFLFLERDWEKDKNTVAHRIESWNRDETPLWLTFFPEGTDFNRVKHEKSIKYAAEHNLPSYRNLLVPRVTGFVSCVKMLGTHIDAIYDFTLCYTSSPKPSPLRALMDLAPKEVHLHIRRYPISTIPLNDDKKLKDWIFQCWKEKDELLDHFKQHQRFPDSKQGGGAVELKPSRLLYAWFLWWLSLISLALYRCVASPGFLLLIVAATVVRVATTYHTKTRQWRGLLPPDDYAVGKKQE